MTVQELADKLAAVIERGSGGIPVAFGDEGLPIVKVSVEGDFFMQTVCYLEPAPSKDDQEPAATRRQQRPAPNDLPPIAPLVIQDIYTRAGVGAQKYGTHLQPHNGRSALVDAYQELLDLAQYLRQEIYEREGK